MWRRLFIISFVLTIPFGSALAEKIDVGVYPLTISSSTFLASSGQKDSGEVFDIWHQEQSKPKYRKSISKAAFLSLVLPGAGEYYAQSKNKGQIFMGADAALWVGFFGLRSYGSWLKKDYRAYAASHAEVNLGGKGDDFFEDITYYQSRDEYNQFAPLYSNGELSPYPQDDLWNWQWDDVSSRYHYRDLRNKSKLAYRRSLVMAGLLVANRIISAIDAIRITKEYNRKKSLEISSIRVNLQANPSSNNPHFKLTLTKSF